MMATTKTRTQRRMEKKQALILLALVLVVALGSFTLGVVVGRRGAERDLAQKQQAAEQILVTPASQSANQTALVAEVQQAKAAAPLELEPGKSKLTFYDNLAKEETVPLGSGINLPPEEKSAAVPAVVPPIPLPQQPIVKKTVVPELDAVVEQTGNQLVASAAAQPKNDPRGTYAVQVGSFAAVGDAGALKKSLLDKGYPAFVVEADLGAKGLWYRVRLGPYASDEDARAVQQLIEKNDKIKGFISRQ